MVTTNAMRLLRAQLFRSYNYYMPHDRQLGLLAWDAQEGNSHA